MHANAMESNGPTTPHVVVAQVKHRPTPYLKVQDQRKRAIRGLWKRNGRYYAQLTVEDPNNGIKKVKRMPLENVTTDAQAIAKYQEILTDRRKGSLPVPQRAPKFSDYSQTYLDYYGQVKDAKRAVTVEREGNSLDHWNAHLGHVRLNHINRAMINSFIAKRQAEGVSGRTVNLDVIAFRNVMKKAIDDGWITSLPTQNLRPLKWTPTKRQLVTPEQIQALCKAATKESKNATEFNDYIRLLAYSGARMAEAMRLKWTDVDFTNEQLTVGSDGLSKNRKSRVVDFNPQLKELLVTMHKRRQPDSVWLFPSPQRGKKDVPVKSFRESLILARTVANIPKFGFHDLRHYFISMCVMSGIDYMTIARWVGHQDGGVLIGKVYGHLSNEHAKRQAQKIDFGGTGDKPQKRKKSPAGAKKNPTVKLVEPVQQN
jgi:integrase